MNQNETIALDYRVNELVDTADWLLSVNDAEYGNFFQAISLYKQALGEVKDKDLIKKLTKRATDNLENYFIGVSEKIARDNSSLVGSIYTVSCGASNYFEYYDLVFNKKKKPEEIQQGLEIFTVLEKCSRLYDLLEADGWKVFMRKGEKRKIVIYGSFSHIALFVTQYDMDEYNLAKNEGRFTLEQKKATTLD